MLQCSAGCFDIKFEIKSTVGDSIDVTWMEVLDTSTSELYSRHPFKHASHSRRYKIPFYQFTLVNGDKRMIAKIGVENDQFRSVARFVFVFLYEGFIYTRSKCYEYSSCRPHQFVLVGTSRS